MQLPKQRKTLHNKRKENKMTQQGIKTKYGTAYIDSTGYYKISTTKEGNLDKHLHRLIYEEHYGKIPKGYVVHHKNHNKLDNDPNNLELMTRGEHTTLHSTGNKYWLGKKHTEETKQKIAKARTGKKHSKEWVQQMRIRFGGKNNPMYGKHHKKETLQKMRDVKLKKYARIIKTGAKGEKQVYAIKVNSKPIKTSFYRQKLLKWFVENYPNTILKIGPIEGDVL